jgi:hypothetical protein
MLGDWAKDYMQKEKICPECEMCLSDMEIKE